MACAKQVTSHYLNQCWPSLPIHICGTWGKWVKEKKSLFPFDMYISFIHTKLHNFLSLIFFDRPAPKYYNKWFFNVYPSTSLHCRISLWLVVFVHLSPHPFVCYFPVWLLKSILFCTLEHFLHLMCLLALSHWLTYCGPVMLHNNIDLGWQWLMALCHHLNQCWLKAKVFCGIHWRTILEVLINLIHNICS